MFCGETRQDIFRLTVKSRKKCFTRVSSRKTYLRISNVLSVDFTVTKELKFFTKYTKGDSRSCPSLSWNGLLLILHVDLYLTVYLLFLSESSLVFPLIFLKFNNFSGGHTRTRACINTCIVLKKTLSSLDHDLTSETLGRCFDMKLMCGL